jgi:hypothetical protein
MRILKSAQKAIHNSAIPSSKKAQSKTMTHSPKTFPGAGAWRQAGCEEKASRPAVTPQLRPQDKVSLPVASSGPPHGRDETFFNWNVSPARRAGRRHRQNNDDR